ncbi:MAG: UbiA family prenyltransferase [Planctomycetota bacterium]|nr:UbiA family prenyltransferase [Planctomycetota bacterium]MDA1105433.1 UbiA family prenyltransferase [Planctomycetota bacterium]
MSPVARIAAFFELVRFANWPTLLSDILLGVVVAAFLLGLPADPFLLYARSASMPWEQIAWAAVGLTLLYWGGMAMNGAVDVAVDARERPDRPIPSGRIPLRTAWVLTVVLLVSGVGVFCNTYPYEGLLALLVGMFCIGVVETRPEKKGAPWVKRLGMLWIVFGGVATLARLAGTALEHGNGEAGMNWRGFALALDVGLLLLAIVLYNQVHQRARWSVGLLGLCRALAVLVAGLAAANAAAWPFTNQALTWKLAPQFGSIPLVISLVGVGAYIAMVSLVARREVPELMGDTREGHDAPLFCPWCDHGLANPTPGHCPECGTDLVSRPPVKATERLIGSPKSVMVAAVLFVLAPAICTAWSYDISVARLPPWWLCGGVGVLCGVIFLVQVRRATRAAAVHPSRTPRAVGAMLAALPAGEGVMMAALGAPYAALAALALGVTARLLQRIKWASVGS